MIYGVFGCKEFAFVFVAKASGFFPCFFVFLMGLVVLTVQTLVERRVNYSISLGFFCPLVGSTSLSSGASKEENCFRSKHFRVLMTGR